MYEGVEPVLPNPLTERGAYTWYPEFTEQKQAPLAGGHQLPGHSEPELGCVYVPSQVCSTLGLSCLRRHLRPTCALLQELFQEMRGSRLPPSFLGRAAIRGPDGPQPKYLSLFRNVRALGL